MMVMTNFPYALAAIDLDDTLVGPDKTIGRENRRAVEKLRHLGCRVILASGRRHANMLPYCDELGLDDYVVSCQGARVEHPQDRAESSVASRLLPTTPRSSCPKDWSRGYTVLLWLAEGVFAQAETEWVSAYRAETGNDLVSIADLRALADQPAEKVVWAADPEKIAEAYAELGGRLRRAALGDDHERLVPRSHGARRPQGERRGGRRRLGGDLPRSGTRVRRRP